MEAGVKARVAANWTGAVLVCGKCSKKIDGGFGERGRTSLTKALRALLGLKKGRKAAFGVVETRCLGICPKNAVVMIDTAQPGTWRIVPAGMPVEEVAALLPVVRHPAD